MKYVRLLFAILAFYMSAAAQNQQRAVGIPLDAPKLAAENAQSQVDTAYDRYNQWKDTVRQKYETGEMSQERAEALDRFYRLPVLEKLITFFTTYKTYLQSQDRKNQIERGTLDREVKNADDILTRAEGAKQQIEDEIKYQAGPAALTCEGLYTFTGETTSSCDDDERYLDEIMGTAAEHEKTIDEAKASKGVMLKRIQQIDRAHDTINQRITAADGRLADVRLKVILTKVGLDDSVPLVPDPAPLSLDKFDFGLSLDSSENNTTAGRNVNKGPGGRADRTKVRELINKGN